MATGEALAEQAFALYKEGRFSESVAAYLKAYELTGSSAILFNIANIYDRKLRELELASDYYRRYLRTPDAAPELVRKANDRLDALKQQSTPLPQASTSPGQKSTTPAEVGPDPLWRTTGLVVGGLGAVSLAVSGVFALRAKNKDDEADRVCDGRACPDAQGPKLADQAVSAGNISTGTFIGGLAALAGGSLLYFFAPSTDPSTSSAALRGTPGARRPPGSAFRATPDIGPQGAALTLTGVW